MIAKPNCYELTITIHPTAMSGRKTKRAISDSAKKLTQQTLPAKLMRLPKLDPNLCSNKTTPPTATQDEAISTEAIPNEAIPSSSNEETHNEVITTTRSNEVFPSNSNEATPNEAITTSSNEAVPSNTQEEIPPNEPYMSTTTNILPDSPNRTDVIIRNETKSDNNIECETFNSTSSVNVPFTENSPYAVTESLNEQTDPPQIHKIIIFKDNFKKMETEDMNQLKEGILLGILEREVTNYDVTQNITDLKGSCLIIKSTNHQAIIALQDIVNGMEGYKCLGPDEENLGILVKGLSPSLLAKIIDSNMLLKLISLSSGNFLTENLDIQFAMPPKRLENGCTVLHFRLNYKAQVYFAKRDWRLVLPGTDFLLYSEVEINNQRVKPSVQLDCTPPIITESMRGLMVSPQNDIALSTSGS